MGCNRRDRNHVAVYKLIQIFILKIAEERIYERSRVSIDSFGSDYIYIRKYYDQKVVVVSFFLIAQLFYVYFPIFKEKERKIIIIVLMKI